MCVCGHDLYTLVSNGQISGVLIGQYGHSFAYIKSGVLIGQYGHYSFAYINPYLWQWYEWDSYAFCERKNEATEISDWQWLN